MATLISDYNGPHELRSYGKAMLSGNNIRSSRIPFIIIAKGNIIDGIKAEI